jgi:thiamine biosynthesis lipoprotein
MTQPVVRELVHVMGTVVTIDLYPLAEPLQAQQQLAAAATVLQRADEVFSTWRQGSPVSRLRRGEITAADAPPEVSAVLAACSTARELSDGWFDPWAMPGGFDPTGYVKGWAAQRALAELAGLPISGALVNAAGDIAGLGAQPSGAPFRIGIADPDDPRQLAEVVELTACIATSGTYERGRHLIDPRTGEPASRVASASVTGADLGLADALATALAVAGAEGLAFIEPLPDYEGLVIEHDGRRQWTSRFPIASTTGPGW